MLYAWTYTNPTFYGYALLWELVDSINDMICMIFLWWPFDERDIKMIVMMGIHHLTAAIVVVPSLTTGVYMDQHIQCIGIALMFAGSVSAVLHGISRTMDRRVEKEAWMDFVIRFGNLLFFVFCRFYIFPQQLSMFFEKQELLLGSMRYKIYAGTSCMIIFNVAILMEAIRSTLCSLRIALNSGKKHPYSKSCCCWNFREQIITRWNINRKSYGIRIDEKLTKDE